MLPHLNSTPCDTVFFHMGKDVLLLLCCTLKPLVMWSATDSTSRESEEG